MTSPPGDHPAGSGRGNPAETAGFSRPERKRHGRSALFSAPTSEELRAAAGAGEGREALFSAPPRRRGTVVVECSRCEARTPVPAVELGFRLVPSVWIPGKAFSRYTRCPACGKAAWCRVHWRTVLDGAG